MTNTSVVTKTGANVVTQGMQKLSNMKVSNNAVMVVSIITVGTLVAIHDLIIHDCGAEGEYDPDTKKVSLKINPKAYYAKA